MINDNIVKILNKYNLEVAEEISSINLAIERITNSLQVVNNILADKLSSNVKLINADENIAEDLLKDCIAIKKYVNSISLINCKNDCNNNEPILLGIHDVIVLKSIYDCTINHHIVNDIKISLPIIDSQGNYEEVVVLGSYCKECKRYILLKSNFDKINGLVLCQIIDKTTKNDNINDAEFELNMEQKTSILYQYGYNVSAQKNLSSKQRHIILASIVESGIMTRTAIQNHINGLIARGEKRENWYNAVKKWEQDNYYIKNYKTEKLPKIITDRIILKYNI